MAAKQAKAPPPKSALVLTPTLKKPDPLTMEEMFKALQADMKVMNENLIKQQEMMQEMKEELKEETAGTKEELKEEMAGIREEMVGIREAMAVQVQNIKKDLIEVAQSLALSVGEVEEGMGELKKELDTRVDEVQMNVNKVEDGMVMMQYKQMEFALRLRGLKEKDGEDLKEVVSEILNHLSPQTDYVKENIDKIYRVNSWFARQRQLPRDIVIYFLSRHMRNEILKASYGKRIKGEGRELLILKEIPFEMLKGRKEYAFLTDELKKRGLQYRWDVPAGIVLTYEGRRHRLNTIWKARAFLSSDLKAGNIPILEEKEKVQTQAQVLDISSLEDFPMLDPIQNAASMEKSVEIKEQRQTRAATRRREREKMEQLQLETKTEAVGGARSKGKIPVSLGPMLQRLQGDKDGK